MKKVSKQAVLRYFYFNGWDEFTDSEKDFINGRLLENSDYTFLLPKKRKYYQLKRKPNQIKTCTSTDKLIINALEFLGVADRLSISEYCHSIGNSRNQQTIDKSLIKLSNRNLVESVSFESLRDKKHYIQKDNDMYLNEEK